MAPTASPAIDHIAYPECVRPYLDYLEQRHAQLRPEDIDYALSTRFLPLGQRAPNGTRREHLLVILVDLLNDVIDSLNTIIADVENLPAHVWLLRGTPSKRLELLFCCFLSEFFRAREVCAHLLGYLRREGFITREAVKGLFGALEKRFKEVHELRHAFVHGEAQMMDRAYTLLRVAEVNGDPFWYEKDGMRYELVGKDGGRITVGDLAKRPCDDVAEVMRAQAAVFRSGYSLLIEVIAGVHGALV